ncbi:hypothetical protein QR680_018175 [Steinernema hermaphroditum]|uniref:Uncharacterized protein n=1 Tax=Steinernema hermaphroditum TaxID=289476 RepID=A0AA39HJ68_9BILA|nr:hypothetical protein QR680_018175 [Steinernema hermaphroditum]
MMDPPVPVAEDHCRILILVRPLGHRSATHFNHLMERLSRVEAIQVSENPKRVILAKFISQINPDLRSFGEFQAHRRIFGVVGVAHAVTPQRHKMSVTSLDDHLIPQSPPLPPDHQATMELVQQQYEMLKGDYSETCVDSRIATFGFKTASETFTTRELLAFPTLEDTSDGLEVGIREFVRQIYFVLESRRLDLAFEKMDSPPCPVLQEEEKYRVGVENRHSKAYKRKCIGRLRKQVADYTLLTGLPTLALDSYQSAIDYLKQASDLLWLAGALEGWACAAIAIKYNETGERLKKNAAMQRVSTLTPSQMRAFQEKAHQHSLGTSIGHQRYHSDAAAVDERAVATAAAAAAQLLEQDAHHSKQNHLKKPWHTLALDRSPTSRSTVEHTEIIEKFRMALENYERFSFAAFIEYECMMKAASVFRHQKMLIETEAFIREHIGKYLDDSFTLFDHLTKSAICMNCATIYREIGFSRKNAFYARLAVLFRLHMTENDMRTESDYRQVYPILYKTLAGYGISPQCREVASSDLATAGPVAVQVKALHEVFMSAMRARHFDAAIRHLCYILEVYFDELEPTAAMRMFEELERLVGSRPNMHIASQPISMDQCGIILPPLQMTRFPMMKNFKVIPLAADLAPTVVKKDDKSDDIFIYCAFQNRNNEDVDPVWVAGCPCEVAVTVKNPFPFEFSVKNLALIGDGCAFEAVPVKLNLASALDNPDSSTIRLLGMPREPGKLKITGYSCEVVGVKNVCRLRSECGQKPFEVEVLPALPVLQLETSLPRAPVTEDETDPAAETTVYSGQTFYHSVTIVNKSDSIGIEKVKLEVKQPKVFGGPSLIQLVSDEEDAMVALTEQPEFIVSLTPKERKEVKFRMFGIDPSATADDDQATASTVVASTARQSEVIVDRELSNRGSIMSDADTASVGTPSIGQAHHDLIPYTGRLLTAEFIFTYTADVEGPEGEKYERTSRLPLAVTIMPAVTVSNWHVLPGDGPATRYVVVDVTNSTDFDAELTYSQNRMIGVQSREVCRVPLLCPCCTEVRASAFQDAAKRASHMMQMQEMEKLRRTLERHVAKHLDIRWSVPQMKLEGTVPVGSMLASVSLLKQLVIPTMSVDTTVNGVPYTSEDDLQIRIGTPTSIGITLLSSMRGERPFSGMLSLICYQDLQNGLPTIDRNDHMVISGSSHIPFTIETRPKVSPNKASNNDEVVFRKLTRTMTSYRADFTIMFRFEGTYKVRPVVLLPQSLSPAFTDEEFFVSPVSFNVVTKVS